MKQPPITFATPRATNSRFALKDIPCRPSPDLLSPPPKLFAATEDSKNPSKAMRKEVLMASLMWVMWLGMKGKRNVNGEPVLDSTLPRIERPCWSQLNLHVKTAERTTIIKRSGT